MIDTRKKEKHHLGSMDMKLEEHDTYIAVRFFEERTNKVPGIVLRLHVFDEDYDSVSKKARQIFSANNVNQMRFRQHPSGASAAEEEVIKAFNNVEITTHFRKNGRVSIYKKYFNHKLHQDTDIPAEKHFDDHGNLVMQFYYNKGKRHRDAIKGPQQTITRYDIHGLPNYKEDYYFINDEQKKKITWSGNHVHLAHGMYMEFEEFFETSPVVNTKLRNKTYTQGGYPLLHKEDGPARITYNIQGQMIVREYYMHGDRFGYNLNLPDEMVKTYYENLQIIK